MLQSLHGDEFSAAFGSSHINNGFDPRAFDAIMSQTPEPTHSVNLAVAGGSQSEQRAMAKSFVEQLTTPAQPQPCLILLELDAGANFGGNHLMHPRAINIYDWPTMRLMSQFSSLAMPVTQRWGRSGFAMAAMGLHYLNIGMLSSLIFSPSLNAETMLSQTEDDRRGLHLERALAPDTNGIARLIANRPVQPAVAKGEVLRGHFALIEQLVAASPVHHLSFVYIKWPRFGDVDEIKSYPDHITVGGRDVPILNLGRPDLYPELYVPGIWHDDAHLGGEGARMVSTLMGRKLAEWYATHGAPAACGS
ncbi:hypothetical protein SAMN05421770_11513 [Granulicella rosea]|uniref:Uncharacterized protein n=1 Tax=Granulicella rosea TaxID=474952 RepID=A0A239MLK4_9BACT|nr:hypothetical protein [Granulicella rosea]SNT43133.1 hypothetical protein SAMN05421770_11513 [Granulicella rosea]